MTSYSVRVFGSIWRYRIQKFGWQNCTVHATGAKIELLGGLGACSPGKFLKLYSLKCNFLHSLDWNWLTGKVFWFDSTIIIIIDHYGFAVVYFLVDSKTISKSEGVYKSPVTDGLQIVIKMSSSVVALTHQNVKSNKKWFSHLKNTYFMLKLLNVTCQTTRHCVQHPVWNETPVQWPLSI